MTLIGAEASLPYERPPLSKAGEIRAIRTAEAYSDNQIALRLGEVVVTVQPGFTLWRIATETLGEGVLYVQVFEANKDQIRDPDLIYPGQVFTIPAAE